MTRGVGRWAAVAIAAGLVACSTQESSTPRATLPAPSTTATTVAPSTSAETTTTVAATTTTSTTAATTTTTTLPAAPAATSIPIIVGGEGPGWLFVGSWNVDEWRSAVDADLTGGGGNPVFAVNALGRPETTARIGPSAEACFDGRTGPTVDVQVAAPEPPGFGYAAIAVPAADRVRKPRPIAVVSGGAAVYQDLGEAAVDGQPVDGTLGSVEQTVVTDLDGDGDDEALVVFEHTSSGAGPGAPGDFATLLLVDTTTRAATTVTRSVVPADLADDEFPLIERFRVLDVVDLNGDGRMEVAVHTWYYEGAAVVVYEYDGTGRLTEVLAAGCGA